MKVKNTLDINLIFLTLENKLMNFIRGRQRYTDSMSAARYVKNNFPSCQYNGAAPFGEVVVWCEQQFGDDWIWNFETIYFKHERDRTAFLLRWQ